MLIRARVFSSFVAFSLLAFSAGAQASPSLLPPAQLTCNHQTDPLAIASAQPRLGWMLRATSLTERGERQSAYRIVAASSRNLLSQNKGDLWDSGRIASGATRDVQWQGKSLKPEEQIFWKVRVWDQNGRASGWSRPASFIMAPSSWTAQWIAAAPAGSAEGRAEGATRPMPVFHTTFNVRKPVAQALLYVSGLGQDEVDINGRKAGNRELAPGWTDYRKHVLYDTYDVKSLLANGENALGVLLGNGMFNVVRTPGRYTKFKGSFGQPQCIVELHLLYRDGTRETVASGPDWQTAPGPIVFSSTYGGENFDARKVPAHWDTVGPLYTAAWHPAIAVKGPGGELVPETIAPIRVMHLYRPVAVHRLPSGAVVYDLGQNFAGWPEIEVEGAAGAKVSITPGELLAPDGSVEQQFSPGWRRGRTWFTYTLKGNGRERWHPRFTYYGFRYVQVEISGKAKLLSLTGEAVHSSAAQTGSFKSSSVLLNRIHKLILMAIENNMESILTDCPHREKLGWLEQTHLVGSALNYDFDLARLYQKIEADMADAQKTNGMVPTTAPQYTVFSSMNGVFDNAPQWGSSAVLDPWLAYQRYGDMDALREAYPVMRGYVDYLTSRSRNGIVDFGLGDWYDIGPKPSGFAQLTTLALTATGVYYEDILALQSTARALGDSEEAARMTALRQKVGDAFQQRFYHPRTHEYDRGSQAANATALALGLVPPQDRAAVLENLIADIRAHRNHVTAGEVGFHYLVNALQENGASDVLLDMLLRTDAPSYGYQLSQGATSLTESWSANPHNSQDHFMLGEGEEWFYAGLGGIHIDFSRDAAHQIVIHPAMLPLLRSADVDYRSAKGDIHVAWKHGLRETAFDLTIPPNAVATVIFPAGAESAIRERNRQIAHDSSVKFKKMDGASPVFSVESGEYHFIIPDSRGPSN